MDEIVITDLSNRVLEGMRLSGLTEKTIREYERCGVRPILSYFQENGWAVYSKEALEQFVCREQVRAENNLLSMYKWACLRRVAAYFNLAANRNCVRALSLNTHTKEQNLLFQPASCDPEKSGEIETLALLTRDEVRKLDIGEKAVRNYIYCGFGAILKYFEEKGETAYSLETLNACVKEAQEKYKRGETGRSAFQYIRKTALWIEEYQRTGRITLCKLPNASFAYVNSAYEQLIQEYREYTDHAGYLKEGSAKKYVQSIRRFFRKLEELGHFEYAKLQLADVVACINEIAKKTPLAVFSDLNGLRSFARFVEDKHPELPNITPALTCVPLKRRRVHEGYTEEESLKILDSIDRESVQGKRDYAMIMTAYATGLRGIDITSLKFESIDWEHREFHIVQEKTRKAVAMPFDIATGNAIADYILNARPTCDSEYVFIRLRHPYTKLGDMCSIVTNRAHAALGDSRKRNGPHGFRRGMGRRLTEAGIPASTVCDVLGHSSTMSVLKYTATSVESLRQCSGTLEAIPVEQEALL